ncbi:MAG: cyanoexosortase A [Thermosynechococcaceae cyanobacterium MS004]|nr:cyanoexosortase A [Thermosynechococcaceae cyanobacterium MS004]
MIKHLSQRYLNQEADAAKGKTLSNLQISLLCLSLLVLVHLSIDLYLDKQSHLMMSVLVWSSIFLLLWEKKADFISSGNRATPFLGLVLLSALLIVSILRPGEKVIGFFPLVALGSWFLIFIDPSQIKAYLKEFTILLAFGLPKLVPESAFGLEVPTARFAAFVLHYLNYSVTLVNEIQIQVPNGIVEVVPACSGISLMTHMLSISVIFLCLFPVQKHHFVLLPLIAAALGFVLNGIRVAVLAALSPPAFASQFSYWHSASGASVFVLVALVLYGAIWACFFRPASPVIKG